MSKYNVTKVKAGDLELKDKVVAINRVVNYQRWPCIQLFCPCGSRQ